MAMRTAKQKAALRKAQLASARKRKGKGRAKSTSKRKGRSRKKAAVAAVLAGGAAVAIYKNQDRIAGSVDRGVASARKKISNNPAVRRRKVRQLMRKARARRLAAKK